MVEAYRQSHPGNPPNIKVQYAVSEGIPTFFLPE
jgi:hypothetical protein